MDYGLLDADGVLLGTPYHYRDSRTDDAGRARPAPRRAQELYRITGLVSPAVQHRLPARLGGGQQPVGGWARALLLIPDLLVHWLTRDHHRRARR
ncbi:hypothetical protein LV779_08560 [Streptomyces thinghirensis]|nr:hypothetical protein [Streptomyces thinghirensis]